MVSTGTIEITKPAIRSVYCDEYSPWNWRSPTGTVRESWALIRTSAIRNSFHVASTSMIAKAASAGSESGSMIVQKMRNSEAPSVRAASRSSRRNQAEETAQHEDLEREAEGDIGRYQSEQAVRDADLFHHHEQRLQGYLHRHRQAHEEEDEDRQVAAEAHLRERVSGKRGKKDAERYFYQDQHQTIAEVD